MTGAIGVVVPVHDEEEHLEACLVALSRAAAHPAVQHTPVSVAVVLDRCRDGSAGIAHQWAGAFPGEGTARPRPPAPGPGRPSGVVGGPPTLAAAGTHRRALVVEVDAGSVGRARAAGCAAVLEIVPCRDPARVWLAMTDADSLVPAHWLSHQADLCAAGADAWAGTVRVEDWGSQPANVVRWFSRHYRPQPGHHHVHGANFGVRGSAYLAGGGFADLASSEDVALRDALLRAGYRVVAGTGAPVVTSARVAGRAPAGFASTLRQHA